MAQSKQLYNNRSLQKVYTTLYRKSEITANNVPILLGTIVFWKIIEYNLGVTILKV